MSSEKPRRVTRLNLNIYPVRNIGEDGQTKEMKTRGTEDKRQELHGVSLCNFYLDTYIPYPHRLVVRSSGHHVTIWMEAHTVYVLPVSHEKPQREALLRVPQAGGGIHRRCCEIVADMGKRYIPHGKRVAFVAG